MQFKIYKIRATDCIKDTKQNVNIRYSEGIKGCFYLCDRKIFLIFNFFVIIKPQHFALLFAPSKLSHTPLLVPFQIYVLLFISYYMHMCIYTYIPKYIPLNLCMSH